MIKKFISIGIILIFLTVGLIGCTTTEKTNDGIGYEEFDNLANVIGLKKPTLDEVGSFIKNDTTDTLNPSNSYEELGNILKRNAISKGYRAGICWIIHLDGNSTVSHAITIFDATSGIIFVEPFNDAIFSFVKMKEFERNGYYPYVYTQGYSMDFDYFYYKWVWDVTVYDINNPNYYKPGDIYYEWDDSNNVWNCYIFEDRYYVEDQKNDDEIFNYDSQKKDMIFNNIYDII